MRHGVNQVPGNIKNDDVYFLKNICVVKTKSMWTQIVFSFIGEATK